MDEIRYWLWLTTRPGCGIRCCRKLLDRFGTPNDIWKLTRQDLAQVPFLQARQIDALTDKDLTHADVILKQCEKQHIAALPLTDARYPEPLRTIPDPPLMLYVRGMLPDVTHQLAIAVVGTRKATRYGLQAARYFGGVLAQNGCIIVSGMARGIDGAANRAALDAGAYTVAVLGSGVDVCYPWQHEQLMRDIAAHGAVISEYPPGTQPAAHHFPERNRIITGLCRGTLVIESPKKSGSLISADRALEQGRDVFAVPGDINRPNSAGCNQLIRQGAAELVQTPADVLSYYGQPHIQTLAVPQQQPRTDLPRVAAEPPVKPEPEPVSMREVTGSESERAVWRAVRDGRRTVDAIVEHTGIPASDVLTALTMLEIGAYIMRRDDGYQAADDVCDSF